MRHHPRPLLGAGRQTVDEQPLVQLEGQREPVTVGKLHGALEIGPRNRMPGHDAAVAHQAVGAVERRHTVVRNFAQLVQVGSRAPRGDKKPHTPCVGLTQRSERRGWHFVGLETDQRPVDVQKQGFFHRL